MAAIEKASAVQIKSAPWHLSGKGYILLYRFPKTFADGLSDHLPQFLRGRFAGGFGAVMVVDYHTSDVGPYGELLCIPGRFHVDGRRLCTISDIYVSTLASVVNGRKNWAIPKQLADISFEQTGGHEERVVVVSGGAPVATIGFSWDRIPFPVSTSLMPFPLVQQQEPLEGDQEAIRRYTTFNGSGTGRLAHVTSMSIDGNRFPDVSAFHPIAAIRVDPFNITFPLAR